MYIAILVLQKQEFVQQWLCNAVTNRLQELLQCDVKIKGAAFYLPGRVVLDSVTMNDKQERPMFTAQQLAATLNLTSLIDGDIDIHNLSLHSPTLAISKESPTEASNLQFLLDAFSTGNDNGQTQSRLRINQLLITNGEVSYDILSAEETESVFNASHQRYTSVKLNASIKELSNDSVNLYLRNLSFKEKSGAAIEKLSFRALGNRKDCRVNRLWLQLPNSKIKFDRCNLSFADSVSTPADIRFDGNLLTSSIVPCDGAALLPILKNFASPLLVRGRFSGNLDRLGFDQCDIETPDKEIAIDGNLQLQNLNSEKPVTIEGEISQLSVGKNGGLFILQNLDSDLLQLPENFAHIGDILFNGSFSSDAGKLAAEGNLSGSLGNATATLTIKENGEWAGTLVATDINAKKLTGESNMGLCDIDLLFERSVDDSLRFKTYADCTINRVEYNGYTYKDIVVNCNYMDKEYSGQVWSNDTSCYLNIKYAIAPHAECPIYHIEMEIDSLFPNRLHLTDALSDTKISSDITIDYSGNDIDNAEMNIDILNFSMNTPQKSRHFDKLTINNRNIDGRKMLLLSSDFLQGNITGYYSFKTLCNSFLYVIEDHTPLEPTERSKSPENNFMWKIGTGSSDFISTLFDLPFEVKDSISFWGVCNDKADIFSLNGKIEQLINGKDTYKNIRLASKLNSGKRLTADIFATLLMPADADIEGSVDDEMNIIIKASSSASDITSHISWGNRYSPFYTGNINTQTNIIEDEKVEERRSQTGFTFGNVVINDTIWDIRPFDLVIDKRGMEVNEFYASHNNQFFKLKGEVGKGKSDSLDVELQKIDLAYLFNILRFHPVNFDGQATGKVNINKISTEPDIKANLFVEDFKFEHGYIGDLTLSGGWDNNMKAVILDGLIEEEEADADTHVQGFVSPANDTLCINIDANRTRAEFLNYLLDGILCNVDGRTSGNLSVKGKMRAINLYGALAADTRLMIKPLKALYTIKGDTLHFEYNKIRFDKIRFFDVQGHTGVLSGGVNHQCLKNFSCDFQVNTQNLLTYDSPTFGDDTFYGAAYVTGDLSIAGGGGRGLIVRGEVDTNSGSFLTYNLGTPEGITDNEFITFYDRRKRRSTESGQFAQQIPQADNLQNNINIDLSLNVSPDMELKVLTNPATGDYLSVRGSGKVNAVYGEKSGFTMFGELSLNSGTYRFTLQNIFLKEFAIQQGSEITFNGDPLLADLNLQTIHTVNSASLNDLSGEMTQKNAVKVNCLMDISGNIEKPALKFGLELPDGNEEEKEMLADATHTDEQMNMQFIYLLGIGKFYTYDYNNSGTTRSSSAMESLISSSVSGQLSNMLSQIIDNDNWNFAGNFTSNESGWNNMEVEGMLSGRMLNNRLLVNGNFGYRDNPLTNNNFIGDFEIQWLLNRSGTISLKGYNKTNDRYFSKTTLTTQGAGVMYRKEFDGWNLFKPRKRRN